ncbi:hypothetical protein [Rhodanobacter sp. DHB23]|uniref:hypothetical protein n=1 Tax=Rhodanobacter sp. DHB23 TaxID=2775923 RepID=UPI001780460F|nr:hypothetical protein [Rhodanobacter sp. DHB23]MBD8874017.1 hypothetical protein [Rhodanobacter sp. DHB23]
MKWRYMFVTFSISLMVLQAVANAQGINISGDYNALIQRGNDELRAGDNAQALNLAAQAMRLDSNRWEAYVIVGGAMKNTHECNTAIDEFAEAIRLAPASKRAGLTNLRNQCLQQVSASGGASATSYNQARSEQAASVAKERADLEQEIQDVQDKIENLQDDADQQNSFAEQDDEQAENLQSSGNNCSGAAAAACNAIGQFGVSKFQSKARDERRQANSDREEIRHLQNRLSEMNARLSSMSAGN